MIAMVLQVEWFRDAAPMDPEITVYSDETVHRTQLQRADEEWER